MINVFIARVNFIDPKSGVTQRCNGVIGIVWYGMGDGLGWCVMMWHGVGCCVKVWD